MLPEMGPPETIIWEFPAADTSWNHEFAAFAAAIERRSESAARLEDARAVLEIVKRVYEGGAR